MAALAGSEAGIFMVSIYFLTILPMSKNGFSHLFSRLGLLQFALTSGAGFMKPLRPKFTDKVYFGKECSLLYPLFYIAGFKIP
jgi:hypothetical protein